jgi:hypothetical protein
MGLLTGEALAPLEPFAQKYGILGHLMNLENGSESYRKVLEVRTLDFQLRDYVQQCEAIPEAERLQYRRVILSTAEIMRVSFNGGCYHSPVGARWLTPDDDDYARVVALPYTGRP